MKLINEITYLQVSVVDMVLNSQKICTNRTITVMRFGEKLLVLPLYQCVINTVIPRFQYAKNLQEVQTSAPIAHRRNKKLIPTNF